MEQSPPALSLQEGASSTLWCNFSTTLVSNVQWYRQKSGGHLDHLFFIPSGTKQNGRLNATTVAKERRSSLYISSAQITDSATYLCAGEHSAPQAPAACTETLQPQSHHRAFTLLIIPHLHWYSFNTDTSWTTDLGLWSFTPFPICISFCSRNFLLGTSRVPDKNTEVK